MRNTGVYEILNIIDGKRYIGSTNNFKKRSREHFRKLEKNKHPNYIFQNSYNKHGIENFKFNILLYCDENNLLFYEQRVINSYDFDRELYNLSPTAGSQLGVKLSQKTKEKMSKSTSGKKNPMYGKSVYSIWVEKYGKEVADIKQKEANDKNRKSNFGKNNGFYGKTHSEENKKKLSIINTGRFTGEKNPMYGKSVFDIWVEKYGKIEADKKWVERNKKISESQNRKNNNG